MKSGIVVVDKPSGMTSHDVVNRLRRIYHTKKVGHTGTLDPDATGVLPICIGQGTRLAEYFSEGDKSYRASLCFGKETDTQDATGETVATYPLPSMDKEAFAEVVLGFTGTIQQATTMYSAIKYQGQPLYKYARQGITIPDLPARTVSIYQLKLISFTPELAQFDVHCSKGTYIRTLCVDIARACGSGGHMADLRRLSAGPFSLHQAIALETLADVENPLDHLIPMASAVSHLPQVHVVEEAVADLQHGRAIAIAEAPDADPAAVLYEGHLVAIGTLSNGRFQPRKVFQIEDE